MSTVRIRFVMTAMVATAINLYGADEYCFQLRSEVIAKYKEQYERSARINTGLRAGCWAGGAALAAFVTYNLYTQDSWRPVSNNELVQRVGALEELARVYGPHYQQTWRNIQPWFCRLYEFITSPQLLLGVGGLIVNMIFAPKLLAQVTEGDTTYAQVEQAIDQFGTVISSMKVMPHLYNSSRLKTIKDALLGNYDRFMRNAERIVAYMQFSLNRLHKKHGACNEPINTAIALFVHDVGQQQSLVQAALNQYDQAADGNSQAIDALVTIYNWLLVYKHTFGVVVHQFTEYETRMTGNKNSQTDL